MKVTVDIVPQAFAVPQQVTFQTVNILGTPSSPSTVAMDALDAETLSEMCDTWRAAVFTAAGKPDPKGV